MVEHLCEPFAEARKDLGIQHALRLAAAQDVDQLLRRHQRQTLARGMGHAGGMRTGYDIAQREQGMIGRRRLLLPDIDTRAGEMPGLQGVVERRLIMDAAAGGGYEERALLHLRVLRCADHAGGFRRERAMQRHEIRSLQQL